MGRDELHAFHGLSLFTKWWWDGNVAACWRHGGGDDDVCCASPSCTGGLPLLLLLVTLPSLSLASFASSNATKNSQ